MEKISCGIIKGSDQLEIWMWMLDFNAVYSNITVIWVPLKSWKKIKTSNLSKNKSPYTSVENA